MAAETIAETLGRSPKVAVIQIIEVTFLRGSGVAPDPVREVIALFRADGEPIVELDPCRDMGATR